MTPEQRRAYAEALILVQGPDVEYLSILEAADGSPHVPGGVISDEDACAVADLITSASITVGWPDEAAR